MRKLFNGLIVVIIIIILALLFIPLVLSFWLQHHYQHILNHLTHTNRITIKVTDFDRGWFVSKATLQVNVWGNEIKPAPGVLANTITPLQFNVQQRIISGPLVVGKLDHGHRLFLGKAFIYSDGTDDNVQFKAASLIRFNNALKTYLDAKTLTITSENQQFTIHHLKANALIFPHAHHFIVDSAIEQATLAEKQNNNAVPVQYKTKLVVENITSRSNAKQKSVLWYGARSINVGKITYLNNQNKSTEVDNLFVYSTQTETNGTTTMTETAHAAQVSADKLNLRPLDFKFSINYLDTPNLINLVQTALKFKPLSEINVQQIKVLYLPLVNLLSQGVLIQLHYLNAGTPDGAVNMQAQLNFPKQPSASNLPLILANAEGRFSVQMPLAWLKTQIENLYDNKKISMSSELTPTTAAQKLTQKWLDNKKLIQDGEFVKSVIIYDKGQLLINGLQPNYQAPVPAAAATPAPAVTTPAVTAPTPTAPTPTSLPANPAPH
jgi:hypothetical protein